MPFTHPSTCRRKVAYLTAIEAKRVQWFTRRKYGRRYRYHCNVCGMWHLTSREPSKERETFARNAPGLPVCETAK